MKIIKPYATSLLTLLLAYSAHANAWVADDCTGDPDLMPMYCFYNTYYQIPYYPSATYYPPEYYYASQPDAFWDGVVGGVVGGLIVGSAWNSGWNNNWNGGGNTTNNINNTTNNVTNNTLNNNKNQPTSNKLTNQKNTATHQLNSNDIKQNNEKRNDAAHPIANPHSRAVEPRHEEFRPNTEMRREAHPEMRREGGFHRGGRR